MTVAKHARERTGQIVKSSPLTAEVALYFIIALIAAGLRLYGLGDRPMQAPEAAQALAAWRFGQGLARGSALAQSSPILFTSNMFLFALFGASDFLARLVLALGGALLVIWPYFLRQRLGRMGALAASFLLALSPSALFFSRYLGGEIVVVVCALAITCGLFGYLDQRRPRYLYLVAVALGLALSAGAGAFTLVFVVVTLVLVLALANRFSGPSEYWQRISDAWRAARGKNGLLRECVALFVLIFILVCTGFLLHFSGLQDGIDLFPAWLSAFKSQIGGPSTMLRTGHPWYYHLQLLILYEPLILVFGLAAVVYLLRWRDLFSTFLAYWSAVAFLIYAVAGGRGPGDVLLTILPMALLAGAFIGRLLDEVVAKASWVREGLFLYWISFGPEPTLRAGGLLLLLSLTFLTVGTSFNLNYQRSSDPREIMVASPTSRGLLDLLETIEMVSSREGDPRTIAVTVHQGAGPALAWYLRDFSNVNFVAQLNPSIDTPLVIAPAEEQEPTLGAQYSGQDFALTSSWKPQGLSGSTLMSWLFYRRAPTPVQTDNLVLWVKQESSQVGGE